MVLSKADVKTIFFSFFSMSMSVNKLECKHNIDLCKSLQKVFKNLLPDMETHVL